MATLKVRYLEKRDRSNGKVQYYWNPPKYARQAVIAKTVALGTDLSMATVKAEKLNAILDGFKKERVYDGTAINSGTVRHMCSEYQKSHFFKDLRPTTQRGYIQCINTLINFRLKSGRTLGEVALEDVTTRAADKLYIHFQARDEEGKPTKLTYANQIMRVARRVWEVGKRWGMVKENPFQRMRLRGVKSRSERWTPEQVYSFVKSAEAIGRPSVGLVALLMYELAQRQGDVLNLTWDNYNGKEVDFEQRKTGTPIWLPVSERLRELLGTVKQSDAHPNIVICETTGKPYNTYLLNHHTREVKKHAGLPKDLWLMDLRRTALTELGDAGGTDDQIRAVSGHRDRNVVAVYVRSTRQQAKEALRKRWEQRKEAS